MTKQWLYYVGTFVVAFACAFWVSGGLGAGRMEVFDTDSAQFVTSLTSPTPPALYTLHPLTRTLWRPLARSLMAAGSLGVPPLGRPGVAPRLMAAAAVALGVTALAYATSLLVPSPGRRCALTACSVLMTSGLVACQPETFGLSFGLLAAATAVAAGGTSPGRKLGALGVLSLLCGGTTLTNGAFPVLAALCPGLRGPAAVPLRLPRGRRFRAALVASAALIALAALAAAWGASRGKLLSGTKGHVTRYLHLNLIRRPVYAAYASSALLVFPVVGPYPANLLVEEPGLWGLKANAVTYASPRDLRWTPAHVLAVAAWAYFLALGVLAGFRGPTTRPMTALFVCWVASNLALHSVWGGYDFFLYSPHISGALLLLGSLGAGRCNGLAFWVGTGAILLSQVLTIGFVCGMVAS